MADEAVYATVAGESNKRKYDDSPPPAAAPPRRASGFSSTPDSAAPPSSYNSVPPPMTDFELAKQKAQEIAARLLSDNDPLKRARVENEGGGGGGFDARDYSTPKPVSMGFGAHPQVASSGYSSTSKKIEIPNGRVGVIIGKGGETIKNLQQDSGAKIQVTRDMDANPNSTTRGVDLMGTPDQIATAEKLINDLIAAAEAGVPGGGSRYYSGQQAGSEQISLKVANNKVGLVIGKGGETIKNMQSMSGARIQVIPLHLPPGDLSKERTVQIDGTSDQIEAARQLVEEAISENRVRNPSMSGSYSQQGYSARPPNAWAPPMQQSGYGYPQPGPYSGQSTQYNMNQYPYTGYPPQPTSAAYTNAAGWDQSTVPHNQQTTPQGGGYDYYNQQQQQPPEQQGSNPPSDGSGYNYSQVPAYSQGHAYSQDAYAAYHAQTGYDQQQQGYNTANYGTVSNPTPEGPTNPSYSNASQAPPTGQTYSNTGGQSQTQSTTAQSYPPQSAYVNVTIIPAGYGLPQPPKLPDGQPAYSQQAPQGQPPSSYSASQAGYGAPVYGAQAGYGQYQAPAYNASYGGGYSQPAPAYTSDAAAPAPAPAVVQSGQANGATKASPPS